MQTVHLVSRGHSGKRPRKNKKKSRQTPNNTDQEGASDHDRFVFRCYFCKKKGHKQKDCTKRKAWFQKKGNLLSFMYFETNLIDVPSNMWWLDSGATIHVSNNMQGFLTNCQPMTT